jgi:hypothetical protein
MPKGQEMSAILESEVLVAADKTLVHTLMEPALLERVDDFRFSRRFKSRAAAMKYLLSWALDREPQPTPADHERWS